MTEQASRRPIVAALYVPATMVMLTWVFTLPLLCPAILVGHRDSTSKLALAVGGGLIVGCIGGMLGARVVLRPRGRHEALLLSAGATIALFGALLRIVSWAIIGNLAILEAEADRYLLPNLLAAFGTLTIALGVAVLLYSGFLRPRRLQYI
jgi:hypothetical protein